MRSAILIIVALVGLAVAFGWPGAGQHDTQPAARAVVVREPIASTIPVTGTVTSRVQVDISAPLAGRLVAVHAHTGGHVQQGQALAELDDREARALHAKASALVNLRERELALAQSTVDRLSRSARAGFISPQQLDDARTQRDVATAQLGVARADLQLAQTRLEDLVIRAPATGLVSESNARVGEWTGRIDATAIFNPKVLFRIIDPTALVVVAHIDEADLADVAPGQRVVIDSEGLRRTGLEGRVSVISPVMHEHNGRRVARVQVEPRPGPPHLLEGGQVDLRIVIGERDAALTLPFGAIRRLPTDEAEVFVLRDGRAVGLRVATGLESMTKVEILGEALVEGDTVVLEHAEVGGASDSATR